ncbi:MAG: hypothetical protein AAGA75_04730 [Cyanobacteria bacterium P01_E01_bin.6]
MSKLPLWRKTDDKTDWLAHCPGHENLKLYYARTYTSRAGFDCSETNQLITNLKIRPSETHRLHYKKRAIQRFANEVIDGLALQKSPIVLVPMPPSKTPTHPDYDDRIDKVAQLVSNALDQVYYSPLIYRTVDVNAHHIGKSRNPHKIYDHFSIDEALASNIAETKCLVMLDDILTSGAHFTAAKAKLQRRFPNNEIGGLFWAKAEDPDDFF